MLDKTTLDTKFDMNKNVDKVWNLREPLMQAVTFAAITVIFISVIVGFKLLFSGKALIGLALFLLAVVCGVFVHFITKREERRAAEEMRDYRMKYITEIRLRDLELGELIFIHDSKLRSLTLKKGVPALSGEGELEIVTEESGMNTTPVVECVKRVLKDKKKIVRCIFKMVAEIYYDEGLNFDPILGLAINKDYILERLTLDHGYLTLEGSGKWSALISGDMKNDIMDHISEHGVSAVFNSDDPRYEFYSG